MLAHRPPSNALFALPYTGQRHEAGLGLYDYNARYYDPYLNRFIQADTIVPDFSNPQSFNRYAYVFNNPLRYTDPSGHAPPLLIAIFLVGVALTVNASEQLPPERAPSTAQGILGITMMVAPTVFQYWCLNDGDCTNEAQYMGQMLPETSGSAPTTSAVSKFSPSDMEALNQFADDAYAIQGARNMRTWGDSWKIFGKLASKASASIDLYIHRISDKVTGAMTISESSGMLEIKALEGFGGGAGTELVKTAISESIARGYGGQVIVTPGAQAVNFYEKLGFIFDPTLGKYILTAETALELLQQ